MLRSRSPGVVRKWLSTRYATLGTAQSMPNLPQLSDRRLTRCFSSCFAVLRPSPFAPFALRLAISGHCEPGSGSIAPAFGSTDRAKCLPAREPNGRSLPASRPGPGQSTVGGHHGRRVPAGPSGIYERNPLGLLDCQRHASAHIASSPRVADHPSTLRASVGSAKHVATSPGRRSTIS